MGWLDDRVWNLIVRKTRPALKALLTVLTVAGICCAVLFLKYQLIRSREIELRQDLQMMRKAIDNFTLDTKRAPQSLQDLVSTHYLLKIPKDPFTKKEDWVAFYDDVVLSPDQAMNGITDVHSASHQLSSNGSFYNDW